MPRTLVVVLSLLALTDRAISQTITTATSTQDPQAMSLLARCSAAMGTPTPAVQLFAQGTVNYLFNGSSGSIVMKEVGLDRARNEVTINGSEQDFVVNAGRGFAVNGTQRTNAPVQATQYYRPELLSAAHCILDAARPNITITYVGQEQLGNNSVYHIMFSATPQGKNGEADAIEALISEFHVYLDVQSFVVVKTKTHVFSPNAIENRSDWETYYSDYRNVNGLLVPFHLKEYLGGQQFDDIVLTSVRTDIPISTSDFQ